MQRFNQMMILNAAMSGHGQNFGNIFSGDDLVEDASVDNTSVSNASFGASLSGTSFDGTFFDGTSVDNTPSEHTSSEHTSLDRTSLDRTPLDRTSFDRTPFDRTFFGPPSFGPLSFGPPSFMISPPLFSPPSFGSHSFGSHSFGPPSFGPPSFGAASFDNVPAKYYTLSGYTPTEYARNDTSTDNPFAMVLGNPADNITNPTTTLSAAAATTPPATVPAIPPDLSAPIYLPFSPSLPPNPHPALDPPKSGHYTHPKLCHQLNISLSTLHILFATITAQLPAILSLSAPGACNHLSQVPFDCRCAAVLKNARYDDAHTAFLMCRVYLVVRKRAIERKRRNAQYAKEQSVAAVTKRGLDLAFLAGRVESHGASVARLRSKITGPLHHDQWFRGRLENLEKDLAEFGEAWKENGGLRARRDRRGLDLGPLLKMQEGLAGGIGELESAVKAFERGAAEGIPGGLSGNTN